MTSPDGTTIAYSQLGSGPPLVLVHGSITVGAAWLPVAQLLATDFTVYVVNRRGRPPGGDVVLDEYAIEDEVEDLLAVLEAAGEGAHLVAHSYGAIIALEAARRADFGALVVYEPPLPLGPSPDLGPFRAAIEAGNLEDALVYGMRNFLMLPDPAIEAARAAPTWPRQVALVRSWLPERIAITDMERSFERFAEVEEPTLIVLGAVSLPAYAAAADQLDNVLRDVTTVTLLGQAHIAFATAPDLLAAEIRSFLTAHPPGN